MAEQLFGSSSGHLSQPSFGFWKRSMQGQTEGRQITAVKQAGRQVPWGRLHNGRLKIIRPLKWEGCRRWRRSAKAAAALTRGGGDGVDRLGLDRECCQPTSVNAQRLELVKGTGAVVGVPDVEHAVRLRKPPEQMDVHGLRRVGRHRRRVVRTADVAVGVGGLENHGEIGAVRRCHCEEGTPVSQVPRSACNMIYRSTTKQTTTRVSFVVGAVLSSSW